MTRRDRIGNYSEREVPETRLIAIDTLDVGLRKHHVMGLGRTRRHARKGEASRPGLA